MENINQTEEIKNWEDQEVEVMVRPLDSEITYEEEIEEPKNHDCLKGIAIGVALTTSAIIGFKKAKKWYLNKKLKEMIDALDNEKTQDNESTNTEKSEK